MPKILLAVEMVLVASNCEVGVGARAPAGACTTVPLGMRGDTATVGTRTPRRSNSKPLEALMPSGEGTPAVGVFAWSAKPPCSSYVMISSASSQ
jgi:hypothetical protein